MFRDNVMHTTAPWNYTHNNEFYIMVSISIVNITNNNVAKLKEKISQPYLVKDYSFLFDLKGLYQKNKSLINIKNKKNSID